MTIDIITHADHVEALLETYRDQIGKDFAGYRGHVYRVLTYAMHFLDGNPRHRRLVETALVFHDIALWTDREMAYLEPSGVLAQKENAQNQWGLDNQLLYDAIFYHHKLTAYSGPGAEVINAVRKADWIDASNGLVTKGMPRKHIRAVKSALPAQGFYATLRRLGPELTNWNPFKMLGKGMKVMKF